MTSKRPGGMRVKAPLPSGRSLKKSKNSFGRRALPVNFRSSGVQNPASTSNARSAPGDDITQQSPLREESVSPARCSDLQSSGQPLMSSVLSDHDRPPQDLRTPAAPRRTGIGEELSVQPGTVPHSGVSGERTNASPEDWTAVDDGPTGLNGGTDVRRAPLSNSVAVEFPPRFDGLSLESMKSH